MTSTSANKDKKIKTALTLLEAWLTEEVLAPQAIPTARDLQPLRRKLIHFSESEAPWHDDRFKKRKDEKSIYWMVYLGQIDLKKSVRHMLEIFPDEFANEKAMIKGNTTLAVAVLDEQGRLVPENNFLSSFAWGYGKVLHHQLNELAHFEKSRYSVISIIDKHLTKQDEDGKILPVQYSDIQALMESLVGELNIPRDEILPGFSVRVPQFAYKETPQPELLNSFFMDDLLRVKDACGNEDIGKALSLYMEISQPHPRTDINKDKEALSQILSPQHIPLTRWPGKGKHPLSLMQQAAVNHAADELQVSGIAAVNGPPGTGKTTLLRDMIAKVILDRAVAMSKFENPANAFHHLTSMKLGKGYNHIYTLDSNLLGHEIVIASSNNKAVENISKEIPSASAVDNDIFQSLNYFRTISDFLASEDADRVDRDSTWGLAAAVLGNSNNKNDFINRFWWDKEYGMRVYLKSIVDGIQLHENTREDEGDAEAAEAEAQIPFIVQNEDRPQNEAEALARWQSAREEFEKKYNEAHRLREIAQDAYISLRDDKHILKNVEQKKAKFEKANDTWINAKSELEQIGKSRDEIYDEYTELKGQNETIFKIKPGFFAKLFHTQAYRDWHSRFTRSFDATEQAFNHMNRMNTRKKKAEYALQHAAAELGQAKADMEKAEEQWMDNQKKQRIGREMIGACLADSEFWAKRDGELQKSSPWLYPNFQHARDALFIAAFKLHRAFIEASAKHMIHNLSVALEVLKGRGLSDKQEPGRQSLWASLFMVVPVISTTLASISRMFGNLGREQLGWLLIDEAGQATPQSIIGAMWRSKKVVVIGDPLQIEPVVTIPGKLIKSIFSNYQLSYEEWAAPLTSAQEIADRSSWVGTTLNSEEGERWVGSPLRVHRRCEEPMFTISNKIAYENSMIYATIPKESKIKAILGNSRWLNVEGDCIAKWSEEEGRFALQLLKRIMDAQIQDPDIFFISPFRHVAENLRNVLLKSRLLENNISIPAKKWLNDRVGTIHTFQGKEAEAVIIVLGASDDSSSGARRWAGSPPNLLNVAVTRAKHSVYVIGHRKSWESAGSFKILSKFIPVSEAVAPQ